MILSNDEKYRVTIDVWLGTAYHGWQVQKTVSTVAETLEKALATVVCHPVKCTGAGRTDAGVHAETYIANFHTTSAIPCDRIPRLSIPVCPRTSWWCGLRKCRKASTPSAPA